MSSSELNHPEIIEAAFADPKNTAVAFPNVDVNKIIAERYDVDEPFTYTHSQLWDMETKKARNPAKYLRPILRPGSLKVFGEKREGSIETFTRVTDQRMFTNFDEFTTVIEQVRIDYDDHRIWFVGIPEIEGPDGEKIVAGKKQPTFHVVHGAVGSEEKPFNTWRIVFLTDGVDEKHKATFEELAKRPFLAMYNEIYVREDLGRTLTRKE